jgi:hypothetical protein
MNVKVRLTLLIKLKFVESKISRTYVHYLLKIMPKVPMFLYKCPKSVSLCHGGAFEDTGSQSCEEIH